MKVAAVIARSDVVGGANVYVRDLVVALRDHGIESHVFVGGEGPFLVDLERHDVPHTRIPALRRALGPTDDIRAYLQLRAAVAAWRPQLIAAHTAKAGALARVLGWRTSTPVVYTPHGWAFNNGEHGAKVHAYRWLERTLGRLPATVLHVSEHERRLADEHRLGLGPAAVVVPNGVPDVPHALRARPGRAPVRIVSVARFEPPKDHATLLGALAEDADLDWELDLVGDGPLLDGAAALARELGIADRVHFHGFRPDVAEHMAASQIFVLISRAESMPLTLLEAMRANLPVVASDVGGIGEVVRADIDGLLVPDLGRAELAKALRRLIEDPDLRVELGAAARARYTHAFVHRDMVAGVANLYRSAASRSTHPGRRGGAAQ